ncbi:MAG: L-arabinose isomerase, partial [Acidimicrobiia bacterium]
MKTLRDFELWFVTGSQQLYGDDAIRQVAAHSERIARATDEAPDIPVRVVVKPVLTTPESILALCLEANAAPDCVGLIAWMHTFSPAKMWIAGLRALQKPLLHLHTQFNRDLPWAEIDMDFMNLNQSAHGDREFGFIETRLRRSRTTVVGHWQDADVLARIGTWSRAACAWHESHKLRIARFGDNMR